MSPLADPSRPTPCRGERSASCTPRRTGPIGRRSASSKNGIGAAASNRRNRRLVGPRSAIVLVAALCIVLALACAAPAADEPQAAEEAAAETSAVEQGTAETAAVPPAPRWTAGDVVAVEGAEAQIAGAVVALPPDLRDGASVLGFDAAGALVPLRAGTNGLVCLADTPADEDFRVACYSEALEPYMARGRELRAEGLESDDNFARRHAEIDAGTLEMPREPTTVYNFGGPADLVDPATGAVDESRGRRVYSVYTPYATAASTGLSETPLGPGAPWIMRPGTPTAHIMVVPPSPEQEPQESTERKSSSGS